MLDVQIRDALAMTIWANWSVTPIAGDASARRYFRLEKSGMQSVILMDDPQNAANATTRFRDIAQALCRNKFAAPDILHHDAALGLMVIADLGTVDFAAHLRDFPKDEAALYSAATNLLAQLHSQEFALPLATITPDVAAEMIDLAALHYAPTAGALSDLHDAMLSAYADLVDPSPHLALRDFHAENLIWRPEEKGLSKVGLLDFQDACFAPAGYDLMSLLRDARRDVDPAVANRMINRFCTAIEASPQDMSAHLACVSAQRNLRVLGIFARLAIQDGKSKYLSLLPRVWGHLMTDLEHPLLPDLRQVVVYSLPPPDAATLTRLAKT